MSFSREISVNVNLLRALRCTHHEAFAPFTELLSWTSDDEGTLFVLKDKRGNVLHVHNPHPLDEILSEKSPAIFTLKK